MVECFVRTEGDKMLVMPGGGGSEDCGVREGEAEELDGRGSG